ncbi:uncharacterized protein LOC106655537 isoform X2 [Trichogramma pretiosum]|uniref:uncharacterized protein LOC106655537 isoform X2 n=1 Tax=Trichogramma pretiosum TaxID=7493 RepID=UPI0006C9B83C|nr:uncharacterized protein LOC106655537 isoform X2 [Trichogramma pretiosum]
MESSDILDCVEVKDEPIDEFLIENNYEVFDEVPDHKNLRIISLSQENSTHTLRKCDVKHVSESDGTKIVFQCEDVKPTLNILAVKKIDDDIGNIIKIEPARDVKEEIFSDAAEGLNLNVDYELNNDVKLIFECQNMKPVNLLSNLTVK